MYMNWFYLQEYTGRAMEKAKEVDTKCRAETGAGVGTYIIWNKYQ